MTTTRASTLVKMASNDCIMIYTVIVGDEDGPPLWVQCTAHGDDDWPATRRSVVRAPGEDCRALWARVVQAVREMKLTRGLQHQVLVRCMTTPPPVDPQQADSRFNIKRALWHDADNERDPMRRVQALGMLAELCAFDGALPRLQ